VKMIKNGWRKKKKKNAGGERVKIHTKQPTQYNDMGDVLRVMDVAHTRFQGCFLFQRVLYMRCQELQIFKGKCNHISCLHHHTLLQTCCTNNFQGLSAVRTHASGLTPCKAHAVLMPTRWKRRLRGCLNLKLISTLFKLLSVQSTTDHLLLIAQHCVMQEKITYLREALKAHFGVRVKLCSVHFQKIKGR